ncbi:hypothetical protein MTO96_032765 [Rhipicephalus appendiculatus]
MAHGGMQVALTTPGAQNTAPGASDDGTSRDTEKVADGVVRPAAIVHAAVRKRSPRFPDRPIKQPLTLWKVSVMRECFKERLVRLGLPVDILQNSLKRLNHFVMEKLADIEKLAKKCIN